jgi:hypothetical protein
MRPRLPGTVTENTLGMADHDVSIDGNGGAAGEYTRDTSYLTDRVAADGRDGFPVEPGRSRPPARPVRTRPPGWRRWAWTPERG